MARAGVSDALSARPCHLEDVVSGYVLANVNWASEEVRRAYVDLLGPSLDAHGGVAIAGSPDAHVLEGD